MPLRTTTYSPCRTWGEKNATDPTYYHLLWEPETTIDQQWPVHPGYGLLYLGYYMDVSKNRDTPKWMVYNGKPYEQMGYLEAPVFLETPIYYPIRIRDFKWLSYKGPVTNQSRCHGSCHVISFVSRCSTVDKRRPFMYSHSVRLEDFGKI